MTPLHLSSRESAVIIFLLISAGLFSRLLPHPPGATALTAVVFACSMFLGTRAALLVTAILLMLSDALIGTYELPIMLSVYGSFSIIGLLSYWYAHSKRTLGTGVLMLCTPALLFFLITNAAVWYFTPWYPKDLGGLLTSYTLGLPFLKNMLAGDLLYVPVVLGALALYMRTRHSFSPTLYGHEHA